MKEMKHVLKKGILTCLMAALMAVAACDTSKWRAKEFSGPPSWENDIGRPNGYGGEDPWR